MSDLFQKWFTLAPNEKNLELFQRFQYRYIFAQYLKSDLKMFQFVVCPIFVQIWPLRFLYTVENCVCWQSYFSLGCLYTLLLTVKMQDLLLRFPRKNRISFFFKLYYKRTDLSKVQKLKCFINIKDLNKNKSVSAQDIHRYWLVHFKGPLKLYSYYHHQQEIIVNLIRMYEIHV